MWKNRLQMVLWIVLGVGTCTLLVAAMQKKDQKNCIDIKIEIRGAYDHVFVDKDDVMKVLEKNGAGKGKETNDAALRTIEDALEKNAWIKQAELFFDNKQILHAEIEEREPLARIFTLSGSSFYIDSSCMRLPLSEALSARVPMFTSFPSDLLADRHGKKKLSKPDSLVMDDVKHIAQNIQQDSFLMAQVAQIDITPQRTYEIIPVLGDQIIKLGNADNLEEKFEKLTSFYKQVWAKAGFEKYETIDVQYSGQVVAVRRGSGKVYMDTAEAVKQFANTMKEMQAVMNDTTYAAAMPKPIVVKDSLQTQVQKKEDDKKTATNKKPAAAPKKTTKPVVDKKQPKAVLKKN
jgi:cell division protein FtsQ